MGIMVSDSMSQHMAPSTEEILGPVIPTRSSSMSRTRSTTREQYNPTFRHSLFSLDAETNQFSVTDAPQETIDQSSTIRRMHSLPANSRRAVGCSKSSKSQSAPSSVQRWAGLTRSVSNWDGLRRDPELWVQDGDCRVHLYERGASRRGPSFCVPLRALRQKGCDGILNHSCVQATVNGTIASVELSRLQSFSDLPRTTTALDLFIPAPASVTREEAFEFHITTRNFFAFVLGQPLVGRHMGQTFVALLERMNLFRLQTNNHEDFLAYAENQGYRDLVECTDYALASLYYAERYKLRDEWIDAFTHCVGMGESVALSPEYILISRVTRALVTRACLEVDIKLEGVTKALGNFLQDDFSPTYLGLTQGARNHLGQFQRFLHDFYAEKFGSWPPPNNASHFPKALYEAMLYDFQNLYNLLVDTQSHNGFASQRHASGGLCILQTLDHFNKRHRFTAQIHPLPLLPSTPEDSKPTRSLSSASYYKRPRESAALRMATNTLESTFSNSKIIQAYLHFEDSYPMILAQRDDKLSMVDGRKLRWLQIYGTLQYLASALRAPSAVRDKKSPEYPLCCMVVGESSWNAGTPITTPIVQSPGSSSGIMNDYFASVPSSTIEPDCNREDYITSDDSTRRGMHAPTSQSSSRSFAPLASLSRRGSRRNSLTLKLSSHCAIIVHGYGDGSKQATVQPSMGIATEIIDHPPRSTSWLEAQAAPGPSVSDISNNEAKGHMRIRTPLLHSFQLDHIAVPACPVTTDDSMTRSDSTSSIGSSVWTDGGSAASSHSSANGERQHNSKIGAVENSGLLGGLVSVDGTRILLELPESTTPKPGPSQANIHPLLRGVKQEGFVFDFDAQSSVEIEHGTCVTNGAGMAFSAPPSPLQANPSTLDSAMAAMSLAAEKDRPVAESVPFVSVTASGAVSRKKKSRSADIISGIITAPVELRDRYNSAIKRLEHTDNKHTTRYEEFGGGNKARIPSPTVTKTSHATKTSSLKNRILHDDGKKEKRLSSFWRR
ncbi:hypothetical protein DE146DRAFT_433449 [Phaeosphaeria sp. MPI-PUGE-AT-0046c]|nr:hypothetical protein DE146DRAFT_433449 [Phaeosphaeria sp. MPI-PUGE-AT-0046c]